MNKLFVAALKEETVGLNYFYHVGVGKINATYNLTKLIHKYKPSEVINYGTAGAVKKGLSGIIECTKFYQRDMDVRGLLDLKLGETPFDNINEIINSDEGLSCGSGDSFVNKQIEMNVDLVDMEAYALAKVCKLESVEFKCFKFISDNADDNAPLDWTENCKKGAKLFHIKMSDF
ncbi:5'-methylthioadenosine nucleosidase [Candidatus Pelagibacter sp.]|jgi:adenosylhomocysteine nucleosidase|uniref:5'-methylthioadenosine nucleosidase n=1 Tax=uncultured Candidatus Pelagibacter sp. TaxID=372654 RepID=UPI00233AE665|nr:5'-methylthioadenosine nucleosidase [uncultured Candidatus Pelagibacter sp.]MDB4351782.1 5'-methylthioadenosine nucleosidase [Candidatus Pelagibacter sp.]MDB4811313.1 5'-methylthioadenosine nucleosidase [Candidatus Pelagibacter sp.]MDC0428902.1 5'-methylthioadenosine nucleosidase [Candidatus Pelagibacter sp.]MDC1003500.1 5'-methylthioadenosine nucleosidase [Candidatus Pelagibacter sp.]MDC1077818.1 5'-methylthioadenosine nucleosidase [Candidatus Pelagibacter sp.]|tara:strand:- start:37 stop:561 length:525 start_codon:yes stop_codon:yes gene_type:complete